MRLAVFHLQKFRGESRGSERGHQHLAPFPSHGRHGHDKKLLALAKNLAQMCAGALQQAAFNDRLIRTRRHGDGHSDHGFVIIT